MNTEDDIRSALRNRAETHGGISQIARDLEINPSTVSRWVDGKEIPAPMLKLLDLYFFGTIPFDLAQQKALRGVLRFTQEQWRIITILATKEGITAAQWITIQIRSYLAHDADARKIAAEEEQETHLRVAEDPTPYRTDGNGSHSGKA